MDRTFSSFVLKVCLGFLVGMLIGAVIKFCWNYRRQPAVGDPLFSLPPGYFVITNNIFISGSNTFRPAGTGADFGTNSIWWVWPELKDGWRVSSHSATQTIWTNLDGGIMTHTPGPSKSIIMPEGE